MINQNLQKNFIVFNKILKTQSPSYKKVYHQKSTYINIKTKDIKENVINFGKETIKNDLKNSSQ